MRPAVAAALLSLASALPAQAQIIDTIIVVTHDVFDDADARRNAFFGVANAIRFKTRPGIVRRELLFRAGDRYDAAVLAETERNLRRLGLFRDVTIDTVRVAGRLGVLVETRDGWTTELQFNASSTGGTFTWSAGLAERNFLGGGILAGVSYRDEVDYEAVRLRARLNRVLARRGLIDGRYDVRNDGEIGEWAVGVPFLAFADPYMVLWTGEAGRHRVRQFRDGVRVDSLERRVHRHHWFAGLAAHRSSDGYLRAGVLAQVKREERVAYSDTGLAIPDSVAGAAGLGLQWRRARFKVVTHYNGFAREEDVDLSTRIDLAMWLAASGLGYQRGGVGPAVQVQTGVDFGRGFARVRVNAQGLVSAGVVDSGRVAAALTVASQLFARHATVLEIQAGAQRGMPLGSEIDLGHGLGPRAFDAHAFSGNRAVWGTLEHRWFAVDEVIGLLGIGFAAFLDYGGAWYSDQPARLGGDVGFGLRLGATRATGANVGRFDLAYQFGDGWTGSRWIFSIGRSYAF